MKLKHILLSLVACSIAANVVSCSYKRMRQHDEHVLEYNNIVSRLKIGMDEKQLRAIGANYGGFNLNCPPGTKQTDTGWTIEQQKLDPSTKFAYVAICLDPKTNRVAEWHEEEAPSFDP